MSSNMMSGSEMRECYRIVDIAREKLGVELGLDEAWAIWRAHSEDLCAGFLCVDTEEEVVDVLRRYYKFGKQKK